MFFVGQRIIKIWYRFLKQIFFVAESPPRKVKKQLEIIIFKVVPV